MGGKSPKRRNNLVFSKRSQFSVTPSAERFSRSAFVFACPSLLSWTAQQRCQRAGPSHSAACLPAKDGGTADAPISFFQQPPTPCDGAKLNPTLCLKWGNAPPAPATNKEKIKTKIKITNHQKQGSWLQQDHRTNHLELAF